MQEQMKITGYTSFLFRSAYEQEMPKRKPASAIGVQNIKKVHVRIVIKIPFSVPNLIEIKMKYAATITSNPTNFNKEFFLFRESNI